jgi:hypothetical protein
VVVIQARVVFARTRKERTCKYAGLGLSSGIQKSRKPHLQMAEQVTPSLDFTCLAKSYAPRDRISSRDDEKVRENLKEVNDAKKQRIRLIRQNGARERTKEKRGGRRARRRKLEILRRKELRVLLLLTYYDPYLRALGIIDSFKVELCD